MPVLRGRICKRKVQKCRRVVSSTPCVLSVPASRIQCHNSLFRVHSRFVDSYQEMLKAHLPQGYCGSTAN